MTIAGIPAQLSTDSIGLISYAGDDVAFLEDGTMGLLAQDYTYDTMEGTKGGAAGGDALPLYVGDGDGQSPLGGQRSGELQPRDSGLFLHGNDHGPVGAAGDVISRCPERRRATPASGPMTQGR